MLRVPNPLATEKITMEDTDFEISVTLPVEIKIKYLDVFLKLDPKDESALSKMYEAYKEITKVGLKSTTMKDYDGKPLVWSGEVPDEVMAKLGVAHGENILGSFSLVHWLGKQIWEKNTKPFFREMGDSVST